MQLSEVLDIFTFVANELDPADHVASLRTWLRLIEMGADGATMARIKPFANPVPFFNLQLSLPRVAAVDMGLVRRARLAMEHMGLDDKVSWPEGC